MSNPTEYTVADQERVTEQVDHAEGRQVRELFAYLCVNNASKAIEFYTKAFAAREKFRLTEPGGRVGHAELDFGGTTLMLSDEFPECNIRAPQPDGSTSVTIHLHVDNADECIRRAIHAGAKLEVGIQDQFYGERSGSIRDPFGHRWSIGHSIEEVTPAEMQQRYAKALDPSDRTRRSGSPGPHPCPSPGWFESHE
ncbi:MAG: VOC family protein [Bryobacteraceae bacterium]